RSFADGTGCRRVAGHSPTIPPQDRLVRLVRYIGSCVGCGRASAYARQRPNIGSGIAAARTPPNGLLRVAASNSPLLDAALSVAGVRSLVRPAPLPRPIRP